VSADPAATARRLQAAMQEYRQILVQACAEMDEAVLSHAYSLGRKMLAAEVTLLEMADLHHRVLAETLAAPPTATNATGTAAAAGRVFTEALAGYEMLLRGYNDANAALRGWNERLEQQVEQIARTLHDESGQLLAAVMIRLDQTMARAPSPWQEELSGLRELLDRMEFQLRRLAHELHPALLTDLGLRPALEFLADGVAARSGLAITIEGRLELRLPAAVELCLYRCVQECLNNAVRHARASAVRVHAFTHEHEIEIRVGDDGRGFDPAAPAAPGARRGMGLAGMRERLRGVGGELEIQSRPGTGAEVRLRVPCFALGGEHGFATVVG
jgi:signal transduction histidine kinase